MRQDNLGLLLFTCAPALTGYWEFPFTQVLVPFTCMSLAFMCYGVPETISLLLPSPQ